MARELLIKINGKKKIPSIGGKAQSILKLSQKGFRTPVSQVIPWEAYQRYTQKDASLLVELKDEINQKLAEGMYMRCALPPIVKMGLIFHLPVSLKPS